MHMNRDIDRVIARLKTTHPMVTVEQLGVAHPGADDDGLWFFRHPDSAIEVQLESSTGAAPFLVESDDGARLVVESVDQAVEVVGLRLGLRESTA
jgi:hypothetical protein